MKKYIYTVMLLFVAITVAQAQRMLPKQKGLEVSTGILSNDKIGNDYYINLGMTVNGKNGNYQLWALEYTHQYHDYKYIRIPQETYTAEGGYSFFLLGDTRKNITLNLGITGIVGYESINRGEAMLYDGARILSEDNFVTEQADGSHLKRTCQTDLYLSCKGVQRSCGVHIWNSSDRPQVWE